MQPPATKRGQDYNDQGQGQALMLDTFVDMAVQQKIVLIFQNAANRTSSFARKRGRHCSVYDFCIKTSKYDF